MTSLPRTWTVLVILMFLIVSGPVPNTQTISHLMQAFELTCPMKGNPESLCSQIPSLPQAFVSNDLFFWHLLFILLNSAWGNSEKLSLTSEDWGNACLHCAEYPASALQVVLPTLSIVSIYLSFISPAPAPDTMFGPQKVPGTQSMCE